MTHIIRKTIFGAAMGMSLLTGAHAVILSDLLAGGSLINGNLVFDQWTAGPLTASDGRTFQSGLIDVIALDDGGPLGLTFIVNQGLLSIGGDDIYAFVDLPLGFRASATGGMAIQSVQLHLGLAAVGSSTDLNDGSNDNGAYVHESVGSAAGQDDLARLSAEFSIQNSVQTSVLDAAGSFNARSSLWVSKNTLTWAVESTDDAGLVSFDQRFVLAPAVPEPSTYALLGLGLLGIGLAIRHRRQGA